MWSSQSKNAIYRDMSSTYICKYTINTSTRDNKFSHWKQKQYQFCHIYQINHTWMLLTVSTLTTLTTRPHRSGSIVTTRLSTLSTRNASTLDKMTLPSGFFMATNNNHNNYRHGHFVLGFIYIAWLSLNFTLETSWVALYSDVCQSVSLSGIGVTQPNLYLFQYIKAFKPLLTLYHLKPISSNLYWPSTSQYRHILIQYHQVPLLIHHLDRHSSANWIISLFTTHLMSHAQYTWSSWHMIAPLWKQWRSSFF